MLQDVRYALRSFRSSPGFTAIVLATIALGIGANTAMFSVVNAVLLRPFSYADEDSLLRVQRGTSLPDLQDVSRRATTISGIEGHRAQLFDYTTGADAERLDGMLATGRMLQMFGVTPIAGRLIAPEDDQPNAARVVMLSAGFWRSHFGSDPSVLGRTLSLSGESYTVVGILPASFAFPLGRADVVAPFLRDAGREATARGAHTLRAYVRLKPSSTIAAAQEELNGIAASLEREYPETNNGVRFVLQDLRASVAGGVREPLMILLATVGFVLLIACVNVANLLIAKAAARREELALRVAIGASRARIVRQVLTESVLLAISGGALGIAVAWWLTRAIIGIAPENAVPRLESATLDGTVLAIATAVTLVTGLLFGLLPAWTSASAVADAARAGTRAVKGGRMRSALLIVEVAMAVVLVVGAGLLLKSFSALIGQEPGFNTAQLLTGNVTLNGPRYGSVAERARFWDAFEERIRATPGVRDVALTTDLPIGGLPIFHNLVFEGKPMAPGTEPEVYYRGVNDRYFTAMGIPMLKGRTFAPTDRNGPLVAVVNDAFVRQYYPGEEVIGRRIRWASGDGHWMTIVGVAADVRGLSLDQGEVPAVHVPYAQEANPWRRWMDVALRVDGNTVAVAPALRREVLALDGNVPVAKIRTMDDVLSMSVADRRFNLVLLASFAGIALLLAAAGIYGVMSYLVVQRTREIGVRLALGATPGDVMRLVTSRALLLASVGVTIGLVAAAGLARFIQTMLFSVGSTDAPTFAISAGVLLLSAAAAAFVPARRAARLDPLRALRSE
jgi:putative ABC transport system permease protein